MAKLTSTQRLSRFWRCVDQRGPGDCWEWLGSKSKNGYGKFWTGDKLVQATHIIWYVTRGHIPDINKREMICHHCDNPGCCNPNHLFIGKDIDNVMDMIKKGRGGDHTGIRRFTEAEQDKIRALYKEGKFSQRELVATFETSRNTIIRVLRNKSKSVKG
jgi:hypothetical protein